MCIRDSRNPARHQVLGRLEQPASAGERDADGRAEDPSVAAVAAARDGRRADAGVRRAAHQGHAQRDPAAPGACAEDGGSADGGGCRRAAAGGVSAWISGPTQRTSGHRSAPRPWSCWASSSGSCSTGASSRR